MLVFGRYTLHIFLDAVTAASLTVRSLIVKLQFHELAASQSTVSLFPALFSE